MKEVQERGSSFHYVNFMFGSLILRSHQYLLDVQEEVAPVDVFDVDSLNLIDHVLLHEGQSGGSFHLAYKKQNN